MWERVRVGGQGGNGHIPTGCSSAEVCSYLHSQDDTDHHQTRVSIEIWWAQWRVEWLALHVLWRCRQQQTLTQKSGISGRHGCQWVEMTPLVPFYTPHLQCIWPLQNSHSHASVKRENITCTCKLMAVSALSMCVTMCCQCKPHSVPTSNHMNQVNLFDSVSS